MWDNIKTDRKKIGWEHVKWVHLAQGLVNMVMNVP
jgi:hypothetical protein